jgi:hypothetical protein
MLYPVELRARFELLSRINRNPLNLFLRQTLLSQRLP